MDVKNKRVLLRCDFNVPVKDGKILELNITVNSDRGDRVQALNNMD